MPVITLTNLLITAYCSCKLCCGEKSIGVTSTGRKPIINKTVAALRFIPLNSSVIIAGKTYVAQDHYNKYLSDRIDIYFDNHKQARLFGAKHLTVTIITSH